MPSPVVQSFESEVIQPFQVSVSGRSGRLDYRQYLNLPASQRSGDEAPVVDTLFTPSVLRWLGFDVALGDATYNQTRHGVVLTRPDYVAHGPSSDAFIWEDKATSEEFETVHEDQLRRYTAGRGGYAVWCNARRIIAMRFDNSGRYETLADVSLEALFGPNQGSPEEQARFATELEYFQVIFSRSRFFDFDQLMQRISVDEATFLSNAVPLTSDAAQRGFIAGSRTVLDQLRLAALSKIQAAQSGSSSRQDREALLETEWIAAKAALIIDLPANVGQRVEPVISGLVTRLGALHVSDLQVIQTEVDSVHNGRVPATQQQALRLWKERATRINAAARAARLETSQLEFIHNAFTVWRERQPDARLATPSIFAEQVAYVFFVRVLLTRILEDKGLIANRVVSDGGFQAWQTLISTYFGKGKVGLYSSSFMTLVGDRVSAFYQHFSRQPLFDWFLPDDYLFLVTLDFLGRYSFSSIGSDLLGYTYENYIDRVARNRKGHFLTRPQVVEYMLDLLDYSGPQVIGRSMLDPACGSGSFLVHAAQRLRHAYIHALSTQHQVTEEALLENPTHRLELAERYVEAVGKSFVGLEIDPFACYLAELNLLIQCLDDLHELWSSGRLHPIESFRIFNTDSLDMPESVRNQSIRTGQSTLSGFMSPTSEALIDPAYQVKARENEYANGSYYVVCNPPYVNSRQEEIPTDYRSIPFFNDALAGDTNLYLLFVRLGLHYLADGGTMAFIIPLTLFGDDSAKNARNLLSAPPLHPDSLVRFYTGNVLFDGVDQAVAIFVASSSSVVPNDVQVAGGRDLAGAQANTVAVSRPRILSNVPTNPAWADAWAVFSDPAAYDVWDAALGAQQKQLSDLVNPAFASAQGDVNATHANPLRVGQPMQGDVGVFKGENVTRFAPLPTDPSDWVRPNANLTGSAARVSQEITRLMNLSSMEEGFVLRQVARLNTRDELKATWFQRGPTDVYCFTNELWRYLKRPGAAPGHAKAIFGLVASGVTCYLLNLFSTNNHVTLSQLARLPIPDPMQFDVQRVSAVVDDILSKRASLQSSYSSLHATFPDTDGSLSISPDAVLVASRLPSTTLGNLVLRGDVAFGGPGSTRLSAALRRVSVNSPAPLDQVLNIFLSAHGTSRWGDVVNSLRLPEPSVAGKWLMSYRAHETNLAKDWDGFEIGKLALDDAISDWYRFTTSQRTSIANGLPWARS